MHCMLLSESSILLMCHLSLRSELKCEEWEPWEPWLEWLPWEPWLGWLGGGGRVGRWAAFKPTTGGGKAEGGGAG